MASKTGKLAISGREVMDALGLQPGPMVGKSLGYLMEMIIDNPELNSRTKLIDILKKTERIIHGPGNKK